MDAVVGRDSLKSDAAAASYVLFRDLHARIDGFGEEERKTSMHQPLAIKCGLEHLDSVRCGSYSGGGGLGPIFRFERCLES